MASEPEERDSRKDTMEIIRTIISKKMLAMLALGFSSGFPFMIIKDVLKAWMTEEGVDLAVIGLFSAVSLPFTFKFVWSPLMDRYTPSFLGRRRGWVLISQIFLMVTIAALGQFDPHTQLWWIALVAVAIAFFAASQDIALDAFRREYLTDDELGLGTGIWMNAWRFATLISVGVAFALADTISFSNVYLVLALMMLVGIITIVLSPEPENNLPPPKSIREAVIEPFVEFFGRKGALLILCFILLYKLGDNMASAMNVPFILETGFTKAEYFVIVKGIGMIGLFGGVFIGGTIMVRLGIANSLWVFGFLQAISTGCFAILAIVGKSHSLLAFVVGFEFLAMGLGQAAYAAYMAIQTNKRFTATQYALMTSLMALPLTVAGSMTGFIVEYTDWPTFYIICTVAAVPGMLLLFRIAPWGTTNKQIDAGG